MNLKCVIIDDEKHASRIIHRHIDATEGMSCIGVFENPIVALEKITSGELKPDLVFVDVQMPQLRGDKLAGMLKGKTQCILTTAYKNYSEEAYENDVAYYLVKPVSYEKFLEAVLKVNKKILIKAEPAKESMAEIFFVKVDGKKIRIEVDKVVCVLAQRNYVLLHLMDKKYLIYSTIKSILTMLDSRKFMQVHKSSIINLDKVTSVWGNTVKMDNGEEVAIGETFRKSFHDRIEGKTLN